MTSIPKPKILPDPRNLPTLADGTIDWSGVKDPTLDPTPPAATEAVEVDLEAVEREIAFQRRGTRFQRQMHSETLALVAELRAARLVLANRSAVDVPLRADLATLRASHAALVEAAQSLASSVEWVLDLDAQPEEPFDTSKRKFLPHRNRDSLKATLATFRQRLAERGR